MAAKVPGFAGAYVLPNSMGMGIYLTDPAIGPLYEDVIRQHFADWPGGWSGNLAFAQVQYSYYQLMEWRAVFFSTHGLTALEVDILANAVVVFIDDENAELEIRRIANCFGVPEDAYVIVYGVRCQWKRLMLFRMGAGGC